MPQRTRLRPLQPPLRSRHAGVLAAMVLGLTGTTLMAQTRAMSPAVFFQTAQFRMAEMVREGCEAAGGSMPEGVFVRDLDGDGATDLILSHDGLRCNGSRQRSGFCGAQVCETRIYLDRQGRLEQVASGYMTVLGISETETPPSITVYPHGGPQNRIRWDGSRFSER